jgi:lipopolysaccharide assembly outer membrane protein LptD (OstA)
VLDGKSNLHKVKTTAKDKNLNIESLTNETDSLSYKKNISTQKDSIPKDRVVLNKTKNVLTDIIDHSANEYIEIDVKNNLTILYNNAKIHYQDIDLEAGIIIIDYKKNIIIAKGIKDSTGYQQIPFFRQGKEETTQDSITVNYKTKKALIYGLYSEQDNGIIMRSGASKKVNDSTLYVRDIIITTDKKKKTDYHIRIKKAKIVPQKKIVSSSAQLYIADVPTPLWIPFAYFPLSQSRTSGILMPTYGENARQGYFLQNGGYYLAISDYFDLALTGDIYTNGSWAFRSKSNYALRYKFNGNIGFNYESNINSLRGFDDYSKTTRYNIRWTHSQAAQANPNLRLSASVNLGSSKYYKESLNEFHTNSRLNNQLSSSISFSKRFVGTPFNLSLSATHSQNTNTEVINMSLPSLQLSMDRIYPFAPKNGTSTNALHKLSLSYGMSGDYRITTTDDDFFKKEMFNQAKKGINHKASLSTNLKLFNYFTVNPNANYKETWYFDYLEKKFDEDSKSIKTDTLSGFKALREYSTGLSVSTNIYGTFKFKKRRLKAIRHTIRPSVSYNYRPDFSFYEKEVYNPETGETDTYSPYQGGIYGVPGKGVSNNIGLSINNSFEAKIMSKDSTVTQAKKITLLNNLNFSTSYNISADTLRWSPVRMTTGAGFFKNKMRININATMDPYAININGSKINKFNIDNGGSLFRLTRAGATLSYSLSNKSFTKQKDNSKNTNEDTGIADENMADNRNNKESDTKKKKTKLYYSKIPWNLSLSYSLQYANERRQNEIANNSLMFSGDIELSPKWNVGLSSSYDFKGKGLGMTRLNFQRDLDSWKMRFSWVPFGTYRTYYFFIGVKSSVLSELKYDKRKLPDKRLF